jgi:hypothetical protein
VAERLEKDRPPPRPQDASNLAERAIQHEVMKNCPAADNVEAGIRERELFSIHCSKRHGAPNVGIHVLGSASDTTFGNVDPHDMVRNPSQLLGQIAFAATDLEYIAPLYRIVEKVHVVPVGRRQRAVKTILSTPLSCSLLGELTFAI